MKPFSFASCLTPTRVRSASRPIGTRFAGEWLWNRIKPGTAKFATTAVTGVNGIARVVIAALMESACHVKVVGNIILSTILCKKGHHPCIE